VGDLVTILTSLLNIIDDKRQLEEQTSEAKQKKVDEEKLRAEEIRGAACTTLKRTSTL